MMSTPKKSYYAVIPASVRYDKSITNGAKLLYGEITALCNQEGYCWANNTYFAELYEVSNVTISNWVSQLEKSGHINRELVYREGTKEIKGRYLTIRQPPNKENFNTPIKENFNTSQRNFGEGHKENFNTPIKENFKDNNTVTNTTFNNTLEQQEQEEVAVIIQFWDNNGFGYNNINAKQSLLLWLDDSKFKNPAEMILKALDIASKNNKRTGAYVEGILKNWEKQSILTPEEADQQRKPERNKGTFDFDPERDSF